MKIEFLTLSQDAVAKNDYRDEVAVMVNGKKIMHFRDGGEPEDNSLGRDWSDIYMIKSLVKEMIAMAAIGEEIQFEESEVEEL